MISHTDTKNGRVQLVIITATGGERIKERVGRARAAHSSSVVVLADKPTWQGARAAFEAGALDYLSSTTPAEELEEVLLTHCRSLLPDAKVSFDSEFSLNHQSDPSTHCPDS